MKILFINGPNLNILGKRENEIYGSDTLEKIQEETDSVARELSFDTEWRQSNIEGEIVTWIQNAKKENFNSIIINPGGYTHTSVAISDAIKASGITVGEVHLTNTYSRESFRQVKLTSKSSDFIIEGLGKKFIVLPYTHYY